MLVVFLGPDMKKYIFQSTYRYLSLKTFLRRRNLSKYRKYFIVSPASIVSPLESKPAKIIQLN